MPGTRLSRLPLAACAAATALLCSAAPAAADPPQPPMHMSGALLVGGADGRRHELDCPAMQHVESGGYTLSAGSGRRLGKEAADLIESRPNDLASGWIIAVRKPQVWHTTQGKERPAGAADLRIHLVCTDDTMSHGA
ncbi:hypothetical protein OIB37_27890 [Streptomyces sp. NBC_00820]|uniref:hypothetical protein n=1 Tax=Streptomyces sp. NBC_00820 TaxID=2975842 RepID=UPI002ED3AC98|nr:hypothetical protein OIB37_27890 [Streptomyces sp. NBC_00820]